MIGVLELFKSWLWAILLSFGVPRMRNAEKNLQDFDLPLIMINFFANIYGGKIYLYKGGGRGGGGVLKSRL